MIHHDCVCIYWNWRCALTHEQICKEKKMKFLKSGRRAGERETRRWSGQNVKSESLNNSEWTRGIKMMNRKWNVITRGEGEWEKCRRGVKEWKLSLCRTHDPLWPKARPFRGEPQRACQQGTGEWQGIKAFGCKGAPACRCVHICVCIKILQSI